MVKIMRCVCLNKLKTKNILDEIKEKNIFVKRELQLVEKLVKVSKIFENKKELRYVIIGGMANRFFINYKLKEKVCNNALESTDIDFVMNKFPLWLTKILKKKKLGKDETCTRSGYNIIERENNKFVYHLDKRFNNLNIFKDICFFENEVGKITFEESYFEKYVKYIFSLPVASIGLQMALALNNEAINKIRAKRISYVIISNPSNLEKEVFDYVEILKNNNIKEEEIHKVLRKFALFIRINRALKNKEIRLFFEILKNFIDFEIIRDAIRPHLNKKNYFLFFEM